MSDELKVSNLNDLDKYTTVRFNINEDFGQTPKFTTAYVGVNTTTDPQSNAKHLKYKEDETLRQVSEYIHTTYHSHYTSEGSKTQVLDLIESIGDAEAFSRSNAIKYLSRFGRKNGKSRLDLLKAIHYCVLLYYFSGLHNDNTDKYMRF